MAKQTESPAQRTVTITAPKMARARFRIVGTSSLVVHRFDDKTQEQMLQKMAAGSTAKGKKVREPKTTDEMFEAARYRSPEGWDGFNASAIRNAMISACRLVGFKMTLAKLSIHVIADGRDARNPAFNLIRIHGTPRPLVMPARTETGVALMTSRPCWDDWYADVTLEWDADQFTGDDIANLLHRAGMQVGIGEGRPDSKNSAGMGWGTFRLETAS